MDDYVEVRHTEVDGVPTFWVDSRRPTLTASLLFRAGLVDEPPTRGGWLHLLEHVALHGPERHGLEVDGSVSSTLTSFDVEGDPLDVVEHLRRTTERLGNVEQAGLDLERSVLASEEREHEPSIVELGLLWRFGVHGPGRVGLRNYALQAADTASLQLMGAEWLTRGNAALVLSGPPPAGLELRLPEGARHPLPDLPPMLESTGCFVHGFGGVGVHGIVRRSASARMAQRLIDRRTREVIRHRDGLAYSTNADRVTVAAGQWAMWAEADVDASDAERATYLLLSTIEDLARLGPGPVELDDLRAETTRQARDPFLGFTWAYASGAAWLERQEEMSPETAVCEDADVTSASVSGAVSELITTSMVGVPDPAIRRVVPLPLLDDPTDPEPTAPLGVYRQVLPLPGSAVVRTFDGGVHVAAGDLSLAFRFDDLAACRSTPHGNRHLLRQDAMTVELNTGIFHRFTELREFIDAGIPADLIVRVPDDEDDDDEPLATRGELGKDILSALLWLLLAVAIFGSIAGHRFRPDLVSIGTVALIAGIGGVALAASALRTWWQKRSASQATGDATE